MEQENILNEIAKLPPAAQREVVDFIDFLKTRYKVADPVKKSKKTDLADESFIGIWRDRDDMKNSSAWVRDVRNNEWREPND